MSADVWQINQKETQNSAPWIDASQVNAVAMQMTLVESEALEQTSSPLWMASGQSIAATTKNSDDACQHTQWWCMSTHTVMMHVNTHSDDTYQHTVMMHVNTHTQWWCMSTHTVMMHINTHSDDACQHTQWWCMSTHIVMMHVNIHTDTHSDDAYQHTQWWCISTHTVMMHINTHT